MIIINLINRKFLEYSINIKKLEQENLSLKAEISQKYKIENIIANSAHMQDVIKTSLKVAQSNANILILGESGTGKELIAKAIHYNSPRKDKPLSIVNCPSIPKDLLESELFGHVKGAFTGAIKDQKGKVNEINGERRVDKIALYITPLVSQEIDVSSLNIQLNNGETVMFLSYEGSENLGSNSIFKHTIWNYMDGSNFGFISIIDLDNSLVNFDSLNDCSDNAYLVFELPEDMALAKHDKLVITLFPSTGISKTMVLKTPLLINSIVTFE